MICFRNDNDPGADLLGSNSGLRHSFKGCTEWTSSLDWWRGITCTRFEKCVVFLTRKSKSEAVLQRRSMLKLGVICKFMKRYGKCFLSWNVYLEFQVLCLGGVIFLSISGILGGYAISATFCSLFSSVSQHWQWRFCKLILNPSETLLCGFMLISITHTRDQSPLKSTLFHKCTQIFDHYQYSLYMYMFYSSIETR